MVTDVVWEMQAIGNGACQPKGAWRRYHILIGKERNCIFVILKNEVLENSDIGASKHVI